MAARFRMAFINSCLGALVCVLAPSLEAASVPSMGRNEPQGQGDPGHGSGRVAMDNIIQANKGLHLFETDIATRGPPDSRNAIIEAAFLWDYKEIPFVIKQGDFSATQVSRIQSAMEEFHQHTCVRFVPRNGQEDYIHIQRQDGCWAWIGQQHDGPQEVILGDSYCLQKGAIIHELMHAVGFWHEHSRPDRDDWVTILWNNIIEDKKEDFEKRDEDGVSTLGLPYDYGSIMHYGSMAHSKNGQPTIAALFPTNGMMGQDNGLSSGDIDKINKLYSCSTQKWRDDGRCGSRFPAPGATPGECNPHGQSPCCSANGYCGTGTDFCDCAGCMDFTEQLGCPTVLLYGSSNMQVSKMTSYTMTGDTNDGRPVYFSSSTCDYLYYYKGDRNVEWWVGPQVGNNFGSVHVQDSHLYADEIIGTFLLWDGSQWQEDPDVKIACSDNVPAGVVVPQSNTGGATDCTTVRLHGDTTYQPSRMTTYTKTGQTHGGRPVYSSARNNGEFLYFFEDYKQWWVGETVGQNYGYAYVNDCALTPDQIRSPWDLWDGHRWQTVPSVHTSCVGTS